MATVYLIHLDIPIHHAKHYLGYTAREDVQARYNRHKSGNGARLLACANKRGIDYKIVRQWSGLSISNAKALERKLKSRHDAPGLCPVCNKNLVQQNF